MLPILQQLCSRLVEVLSSKMFTEGVIKHSGQLTVVGLAAIAMTIGTDATLKRMSTWSPVRRTTVTLLSGVLTLATMLVILLSESNTSDWLTKDVWTVRIVVWQAILCAVIVLLAVVTVGWIGWRSYKLHLAARRRVREEDLQQLWEVSDYFCPATMDEFFADLMDGDSSVSRALFVRLETGVTKLRPPFHLHAADLHFYLEQFLEALRAVVKLIEEETARGSPSAIVLSTHRSQVLQQIPVLKDRWSDFVAKVAEVAPEFQWRDRQGVNH